MRLYLMYSIFHSQFNFRREQSNKFFKSRANHATKTCPFLSFWQFWSVPERKNAKRKWKRICRKDHLGIITLSITNCKYIKRTVYGIICPFYNNSASPCNCCFALCQYMFRVHCCIYSIHFIVYRIMIIFRILHTMRMHQPLAPGTQNHTHRSTFAQFARMHYIIIIKIL